MTTTLRLTLLTVCIAAVGAGGARAEDPCTPSGAVDRALRARERIHAAVPERSDRTTLSLPEDVGELPRAAVRARTAPGRPLDVFAHLLPRAGGHALVVYGEQGEVRWRRPSVGAHAVAACARTVYVLEGSRLEALEHGTGARRWSIGIEGEVVRLAAIGCDALVARRASTATTRFAEVVHVLAAADGRPRAEVPCEGCLPRAIAGDTFTWTEPDGVRVLDARGDAVRLHVLRLPEDDDIKGRAGDTLITYGRGELAGTRLDGTVAFRKRGRARVLTIVGRHLVLANATSIDVVDLAGVTQRSITADARLREGLADARAVPIDDVHVLVRMTEPLPLEAIIDVERGVVRSLRALPFAAEATIAHGRLALHVGVEALLEDALAESAPLRAIVPRAMERAALTTAITRIPWDEANDFSPHWVGLGRCALAERPAMQLALLGPPEDGTFDGAFARAIVAEITTEHGGAPHLAAALEAARDTTDEGARLALASWLERDDTPLTAGTIDALLATAERMLAGAAFADARVVLLSPACAPDAGRDEACLRADAALGLVRAAYARTARERGGTDAFARLERGIAARAGAPLAGTTRTGEILRAAARAVYAFEARPPAMMTAPVAFDFPTAFGVHAVVAAPSASRTRDRARCGVTFAAPRTATRVERGELRAGAAYLVRIDDSCTGDARGVLVTASPNGFVARGEAYVPR